MMSVATPDAGRQAAVGAQHHRHLAERVLAPGHRVDRVLAQLALGPGRLLDRAEDGVDRAVAAGLADRLLARGQRDPDLAPAARGSVPGLDLEGGQLVGVGALAHLVGDDRLQVERGHLLLAVGDLLEAP